MRARTFTSLAALASLVGCSAATSDPDATPADGHLRSDAPWIDAHIPDAPGPCAGALLFTGAYVDWDSTEEAFRGIDFATLREVGQPGNTVMTAPNGRASLCLPAAEVSQVDFVHPDYLPLRYTVQPGVEALQPFEVRGLSEARAEELYTLDLGLTRDDGAAQALVAVRTHPDGAPATGAIVRLAAPHAGAFTDDGTGRYGAGDTVLTEPLILFANVEPGVGTAPLEVTPPAGMTCAGPDPLFLVPGHVAATTVLCAP